MKILSETLKRTFDLLLSIIGIIISFPIMLIIAIFIKLDSKGSIFFKQLRLGKDVKSFNIYKFRSMEVNAEQKGTGLFNYEDDPRVTRVGSILRKTSLDELPQFFNILLGNMSFVGPRPPVTYELGPINKFSADLLKRFTVKPGVTGLSQIRGRNELSWEEKIKHDLEYIDKFTKYGIILDFIIIFKTVSKVLKMEGSYENPKNANADSNRIQQDKK